MLALLSAVLSVPAKPPRTRLATALVSKDDVFSSGDCESWCPTHAKDWGTKCAWASGECSACTECSHSSSGSPPPLAPSLQLDTVVPDASFAWTTFSSGADCEAHGCVTPSSQAECEDAMRALTTTSTLSGTGDYNFLRCFTNADSSTPASDSQIYYNTGATTGACGNKWHCACQCPPSPPAPPAPPDMCECTGVGNQISCSLTGVRYCSSAEECFAPPGTPYPFGQWSDLCKQSGRRLQQSSA